MGAVDKPQILGNVLLVAFIIEITVSSGAVWVNGHMRRILALPCRHGYAWHSTSLSASRSTVLPC
jgi:hypothetical protein